MDYTIYPYNQNYIQIQNFVSNLSLSSQKAIYSVLFSFKQIGIDFNLENELTRIILRDYIGKDGYEIKKLPKEFAYLKNLSQIALFNTSIQDLSSIPQSIESIYIENHSCKTWPKLPQTLPNLRSFSIVDGPFSKFKSFVSSCPNLRFLSFSRNKISYINDFPPALPNLQYLDLSHNQIYSMRGFPKFPQLLELKLLRNKISSFLGLKDYLEKSQKLTNRKLIVMWNPLCSLYGCPLKHIAWALRYLKKNEIYFPNSIPPIYSIYLNELRYNSDEIYSFFKLSPDELVIKYHDKGSLSLFEQNRIIYEGDNQTLHLLVYLFGSRDIIVNQLAERLQISLKINGILK